jgi:hypothetical protein
MAAEAPDYPLQWQHTEFGQPSCTAFYEAGTPDPWRCERTADMFEAAAR